MINRKPIKRFEKFEGGRFVRPIYKDYSFANLPATIIYLLTGQKTGSLLPADCFGGSYPEPKKIVLFFIDGFGFLAWEKYVEKFAWPKKVVDQGVLTPISALFPSTTSASVTTLHLGVLPSQHAMFEWNLYVPEYNDVIQSLPFCPLGTKTQDACLNLGYDPQDLYVPHPTIYDHLKTAGVRSVEYLNRGYARCAYNRLLGKNAKMISVKSLADGLVNLAHAINESNDRTFFHFYWGDIDSLAHDHGPDSAQYDAEVASFWLTFDYVFSQFEKGQETLFLFTADHGQVAADPKKAYYLNREIPGFEKFLKKTSRGEIIYPTGSARDVFLHVWPDKVEEVYQLLEEQLEGIARVMLIEEAKQQGLFGPPPFGEEFLERVGDILILPYAGKYVWWFEEDKLSARHQASHGGLTPAEMLTVLGTFL